MRTLLNLVIILVLMNIFISTGQAQNQEWNLNFKGGVLFPGTVSIEGYEVDTETGWIFNVAGDAMVAEKLSMGGYFLYAGTSEEISGETANIMSIGGTLKGRFTLRNGTQIRPGVIFAYQTAAGDAFEDVQGLNIGFTGEVAFPLENNRAIVGELGFTSQPAGGNEFADVQWAPILYITIGYEFGG